jgi:energy-coupling factor transporter ATP-binding protein EcfA2
VIRFEQVGVRYPGSDAAVLSGVDLHVPEGELALVVGPEGGLTDEEVAALGGSAVRLGAGVLRTSSAGAAACAAGCGCEAVCRFAAVTCAKGGSAAGPRSGDVPSVAAASGKPNAAHQTPANTSANPAYR